MDELLIETSLNQSFSTIPAFDYEIVSNTVEGNEYLSGRRDMIQIRIEGVKSVVLNSVDLYGKRLVVEYDFDSDYELYEEILLSVPETRRCHRRYSHNWNKGTCDCNNTWKNNLEINLESCEWVM